MEAWGKWNAQTGQMLPLSTHGLDVACLMRHLLDQPRLARWAQELAPLQKDRLAALAALHDFGKANRGFQAKNDPQAKGTAGHVLEAVALLANPELWPDLWRDGLNQIQGWFKDPAQAQAMWLACLSHHGRPLSAQDIEPYLYSATGERAESLWAPAQGYDPLANLDTLILQVKHAYPQAFCSNAPPIDATPSLQQRFAGLLMLADWIGSDTTFFPFQRESDLKHFCQDHASRVLQAIGLTSPPVRASRPFAEIFGFPPSALQKTLAQGLQPDDDTRLLLIESDTGSGKTEAALAWFFRLYAEGHVDGLYFALPTRVAARELYGRVLRAIEAAFPATQRPGPVLLAAPGYVKVDGLAVGHVLTDPQGTLWDERTDDLRRERLWAAERPKRFLAAPIAVGTLDQALLSVLQVKHSLLRSVCLDRHLLVVDEVHASDPYMREVLKTLLQGHIRRGGWALLLSATLGEAAAAKYFVRPCQPLKVAEARPYPLISSQGHAHPLSASRERTIALTLAHNLSDDANLLPPLIDALTQGARVLVICNTVARANRLFREVEVNFERNHPDLLKCLFSLHDVRCPHHGRFARADREILDAAVSAQFGKAAPTGPRLLIGTQTLEQSLDIDADWLVTDLAPMDVLLQRFGRLHRHTRPRPHAYTQPQALVRIPEQELASYLTKDCSLRGPAGLGTVYADGRVLALTLQSLQAKPTLCLPNEARSRIEATTHPESFAHLPAPWPRHGAWIEGKTLAELRQALHSVLEDIPFGDLHYPDKSEQILTRLGEPSYDLPLVQPMPSPFGASIERVVIPARWLEGFTPPDAIEAHLSPEGFDFTLGPLAFRYTRLGLEIDHE